MKLPESVDRQILFEYLLRLGDERLVLGHRLSEWCGHAPILEEDIALANLALDLLGQSEALLDLASQVEGRSRTPDELAFLREAIDFRNPLIVELPIGDFAFTISRQFLFDVYSRLYFEKLEASSFEPLAGIARKTLQEIRYHHRHSRQWMLRLGDGTEESNRRTRRALDELWRFTAELFQSDDLEAGLLSSGIAPDRPALFEAWQDEVAGTLAEAGLQLPREEHRVSGGRSGQHTEHLGHLLAEMQILARSFPGASW